MACGISTTRSRRAARSRPRRSRIGVFSTEEPTDGYQLLRLFAAYSFQTGGAVSTITARLDNATDELYRNHLSYIKDLVPEMGRNFKVLYNVKF